MGEIIDMLEARGCDVDGAMERFMHDEEFYMECFYDVLADENFLLLGDYIRERDVDRAFDCAHMLKGLLSNMGISSMHDIIVQMVELLRGGVTEGLMDMYGGLIEEKKSYDAMLERGRSAEGV